MRLIINLALVAIVAVLIYALYDSIREPIAFKDVKESRALNLYLNTSINYWKFRRVIV